MRFVFQAHRVKYSNLLDENKGATREALLLDGECVSSVW